MRKYYLHISEYVNKKITDIGSVRTQFDIARYLLAFMEFLNVQPFETSDKRDADFMIYVDKMSRLFWGKGDKIHSIQYPFSLKEQEQYLLSEFQGRIIDSRTIAILSSVVENEDIRKSIYNMFDGFMEIMNEFDIDDDVYGEFCWELLLYLLSFETGYLRYDHDENKERVDKIMHPVDHIDLFYSGNTTFKVGLADRIEVEDLRSIVDIKEKCYWLGDSR